MKASAAKALEDIVTLMFQSLRETVKYTWLATSLLLNTIYLL
ncbi:hypothetical protein APHMUC_0587 [Anaplasma phagocytophilum str. ApMUC09]|uniref:Uncharacterized protein n=1 Tax=Anaplasma phagocytophilum str. ApMUC09 TaxID=1359152 RepID=A0A0F3N7S1_ANAPH|nr:hypothetical protein APHMUC_0587 [Anaplasma phagocytophilum str. ApMUC09]